MQRLVQRRGVRERRRYPVVLVGDFFHGGLAEARGLRGATSSSGIALDGADIGVVGVQRRRCLSVGGGAFFRPRIRGVGVFACFDGFGDAEGVVLCELDLCCDFWIHGRPYLEELQEGVGGLEGVCCLPGWERSDWHSDGGWEEVLFYLEALLARTALSALAKTSRPNCSSSAWPATSSLMASSLVALICFAQLRQGTGRTRSTASSLSMSSLVYVRLETSLLCRPLVTICCTIQ